MFTLNTLLLYQRDLKWAGTNWQAHSRTCFLIWPPLVYWIYLSTILRVPSGPRLHNWQKQIFFTFLRWKSRGPSQPKSVLCSNWWDSEWTGANYPVRSPPRLGDCRALVSDGIWWSTVFLCCTNSTMYFHFSEELWADSNFLTGSIPTELGNLSMLGKLLELPSWSPIFVILTNRRIHNVLESIQVGLNDLTGEVPLEVCNIPTLGQLVVAPLPCGDCTRFTC